MSSRKKANNRSNLWPVKLTQPKRNIVDNFNSIAKKVPYHPADRLDPNDSYEKRFFAGSSNNQMEFPDLVEKNGRLGETYFNTENKMNGIEKQATAAFSAFVDPLATPLMNSLGDKSLDQIKSDQLAAKRKVEDNKARIVSHTKVAGENVTHLVKPSAITPRDGFKTEKAMPTNQPKGNGKNNRGKAGGGSTTQKPRGSYPPRNQKPVNNGKPGTRVGELHQQNRGSIGYVYRWDGNKWTYLRSVNRKMGQRRSSNNSGMSSIPTATSLFGPSAVGVINSGNKSMFKKALFGGLRIVAKVWLGNIVCKATTGNTSFSINSADNLGQWYFNPLTTVYIGDNAVSNMAKYFDKYKLYGIRLIYNTEYQSGNTTNYQITWCLCDSIDHWERMNVTNSVTTPSKTQIMSMSSATTFSAWIPEQVIGRTWKKSPTYYTATAQSASSNYSYGDPIAAARQSYACTAGIRVDGPIPGADLTLGDISLEFDLELMDMSMAYSHAITFKTRSLVDRLAALEQKLESKYSDDDSDLKEKSSSKLGLVSKSEPNDDYINVRAFSPIIAPKKSSSVKSNSSQKKFDSTLGYPGEGPFYCDRKDLHKWCENAMDMNLSYYNNRKACLQALTDLRDDDGTFNLLVSTWLILKNGLSARSERLNDSAVLSLTQTIADLYKLTDDDDVDDGAARVGKGEKSEKAKSEE